MPRARRSRVRAARRRTLWIDTTIDEATPAGTADDANLLVTTPSNLETKGFKVVRTIIDLTVKPGALAGATGSMFLSLGIGVIEDDAFAAGVFPDLNVADEAPASGWLYKSKTIVQDDTAQNASVIRSLQIKADIRTSRNIGRGVLVLMLRNDTFTGTSFTVDTGGLIRCLYELP